MCDVGCVFSIRQWIFQFTSRIVWTLGPNNSVDEIRRPGFWSCWMHFGCLHLCMHFPSPDIGRFYHLILRGLWRRRQTYVFNAISFCVYDPPLFGPVGSGSLGIMAPLFVLVWGDISFKHKLIQQQIKQASSYTHTHTHTHKHIST